MGYVEARRLTSADELWLCDNCEQQGVKANGYMVNTSYDEPILWFCYNCKHKLYKGKFND